MKGKKAIGVTFGKRMVLMGAETASKGDLGVFLLFCGFGKGDYLNNFNFFVREIKNSDIMGVEN